MLQVIIGIVFVLLLFSLLASTILEIISGMMSLRGKNLLKTIENMLGDKADDFVRHPLYKQLTMNARKRVGNVGLPSYLKNSSFSGIVIDLLNDEAGDTWAEKIKNLPDSQLKKLLMFLFRQAGGDMTAFQTKVETWFDEVMDHASGIYKRLTQLWLLLIGLGIAVVFNADVFTIYHNLSVNSALSDYIANSAVSFLEKNPTLPTTATTTSTTTGQTPSNTTTSAVQKTDSLMSAQRQMDKLLHEEIAAIKSPLGLGWTNVNWQDTVNPIWWLYKIVGWLTTALAISLGAPFWFEALRKLVSMRGGSSAANAKEPDNKDKSPGTPKSDDQAFDFQLESKKRDTQSPRPVASSAPARSDAPRKRGSGAG